MIDADNLAALHEAATPGPFVAVRLAHVVTHREGASERIRYTPEDDALLLYLRNAVPDILALIAERDRLAEARNTLFDTIKHGDQEHQAWLKCAIDRHFGPADTLKETEA